MYHLDMVVWYEVDIVRWSEFSWVVAAIQDMTILHKLSHGQQPCDRINAAMLHADHLQHCSSGFDSYCTVELLAPMMCHWVLAMW